MTTQAGTTTGQAERFLRDLDDFLGHATGGPGELFRLRAELLGLQAQGHDLDPALGDRWRRCKPAMRRDGLARLVEGARVGTSLREAVLRSLEADDEVSANAALTVLSEASEVPLDDEAWRRIARVARRERGQVLPDREAALLLARQGPPQALATVALTAFRPGPEDADDRLVSLACLGRFADPRVAGWLRAVLQSGAATLEAVQAAAIALHRGLDPAEIPMLVEGLHAAVRLAATDATARWSALDGLCHLADSAALPWVVAAWRAGGPDAPAWFLDACRQRARELAPQEHGTTPEAFRALTGPLPEVPPLGDLLARLHSRDARVARRAMVEWQAAHGSPLEIQARAEVEAALVARGQLLGSFVATDDTRQAELGPPWAPTAGLLPPEDRKALQAEEKRWLGQ